MPMNPAVLERARSALTEQIATASLHEWPGWQYEPLRYHALQIGPRMPVGPSGADFPAAVLPGYVPDAYAVFRGPDGLPLLHTDRILRPGGIHLEPGDVLHVPLPRIEVA
jgi:hypothetical protein